MHPLVRIGLGLLFGLTTCGIITGYQGILPVLLDEGAYANLCNGEDCTDQLNRLNLMYTVSITVLNIMTLPAGIIIGILGPVMACMIGCLSISIGSIIFAFSTQNFQGWFFGYILMAAGSPLVGFPLFTLPSLYPKRQGLIYSLVIASFDGASGVMYIFQLLYTYAGVSTKILFSLYLIFPCGLFLCSPMLFTRVVPCLNKEKRRDSEESNLLGEFVDAPPFDGSSLGKLMRRSAFYILTFWFASNLITKYFFLTNINSILMWITDGNTQQSSIGTQIFSIILPFAGLFSPITAYFLDKRPLHQATLALGILTMLIGLLSIVPVYWMQYLTMFGIVFGRFFFFSTAPLLMDKLYGGVNVNPTIPIRVYGIVDFIAATLNLSSFAWSYLCVENNQNFYIFNTLLPFICLSAGIIMSYFLSTLPKKRNLEITNE